jgi:hypothetical protein
MKLATIWTRNVPNEKKESYEQVIRSSSIALERLYEICEEWEEELTRAETKLDDFSGANWALRQAFRNGDRSRIRRVKELLSFLKGE